MFLNRHLRSIYIDIKRITFIIRSYCDLGIEMKKLNDKKEFQKALDLFDQYKEKTSEILSAIAINQALKSCTNINDFQRGSTIHNQYSSRIGNNSFISASLIHLYS
jgi:hypothetical protein